MTYSEVWDEVHNRIDWVKDCDHCFSDFIEKNFELNKNYTFLDLGCGVGACTTYLAKRNYKVIAVDVSSVAIQKLRNNLGFLTPNVDIRNLDVRTIDFPDKSLDCIVDVACLSSLTLDEANEIVKKAGKWLKPSGKFYSRQLCEPYSQTFKERAPSRMVSTEEIGKMFAGGGFVGEMVPNTVLIKWSGDHLAMSFFEAVMTAQER